MSISSYESIAAQVRAKREEAEAKERSRNIGLFAHLRHTALAPQPVTLAESLISLFVLQQWFHVPLAKDGRAYGANWFLNQKDGFLNGINQESRRVILRLIAAARCIACGETVNIETSAGDHLIAIARGGRNSLTNYLPMCRSDNASKGKKDLIEWWLWKGRPMATLSKDVLCIYARLHWQLLPPRLLFEPAPSYLPTAVTELLGNLPSAEHGRCCRRVIETVMAGLPQLPVA
jgi:hypothetical protein